MDLRKLIKDKKGISNQIMLVIIMGIVLAMIVLLVFLSHLILPPLQSVSQDTNGIIQETFQSSGDQNLIDAGEASFQPAAESLNNLEWMSYTLVILSFLVFLIMCFYVRTYPFLMFVWIIMMVVLIFISLYLTTTYQGLVTDDTLGGYYTSWENTDFILQNLPIILVFVGIIGGAIMFMLASRDRESELGGGPL